MIVIVDYNAGNIGSVKNMLSSLSIECIVSGKVADLERATKIILPGVGAFDHGMQNLERLNLVETLKRRVLVDKIPILGICLGAQLLTISSDEGSCDGLGFLDAVTVKFPKDDLKLPHIGWNTVQLCQSNLFEGLGPKARFYFVHNFYMKSLSQSLDTATTSYIVDFDSAIIYENIYAMQFHPEKSHKFGRVLLNNFCRL